MFVWKKKSIFVTFSLKNNLDHLLLFLQSVYSSCYILSSSYLFIFYLLNLELVNKSLMIILLYASIYIYIY